MLKKFCERARGESGFTLIELLVVMLILGILAAIAIPAFLNQKGKANDSQKKVEVRTMQTAMETCATDNTGANSYTGCDLARIQGLEPGQIPNSADVDLLNGTGTATGYTVTSSAANNTANKFQVTKNATTGVVSHDCGATSTGTSPPVMGTRGTGGCPSNGSW